MAADSKTKLLYDAERYVLQGKTQQAISEYLKIVSLDPDDVLILNTIGDLYLRQRNSFEANKYFTQVAENYVHNNFFLKAIAVYKKILNADPNSLEINLTMASLYAKQGLSIDARNQYTRVSALLEKDGKTKELLEIYEKIVELDPLNSAVQRKLAELHEAEGASEKSHTYWTGAARAQEKAGDLTSAVDSYERAMKLVPLDVSAMKSFMDCCLKMGNLRPVFERLKKSVDIAPENLDMREMLGQVYLERGDPEAAIKAFQVVVSMDESRYDNFFSVAQALIDRDAYDQAIDCLDTIAAILITRRETGRAAKLYELILERRPKHVSALKSLASLYSATGNQPRYLEILDELSDYYASVKSPVEALEYLEKIIKADPESDKHRILHQQVFAEAYPDTPYVAPVEPQESIAEPGPAVAPEDFVASKEESPSAIVEVDLLLNYGLKDKALSLLKSLEARDPFNKEVRTRLLTLYKAEKKNTEAAEQCLFLAALQRKAKNEEAVQSYLEEAKQLAPDLAEYEADLDAFARRNGIVADSSIVAPTATEEFEPDSEVDLSSDLLDIFYAVDQESPADENSAPQVAPEEITEAYPQAIPAQAPAKSMQEQLQEVDFYIRLGFNEEARSKLDEIAKISLDNPELAVRYQKLSETEEAAPQQPAVADTCGEPSFGEFSGTVTPQNIEDFPNLGIDDDLDHLVETHPQGIDASENSKPLGDLDPEAKPVTEAHSEEPHLQNAVSFEITKTDSHVNDMFADLMEEVSSPAIEEFAKASFEEHFSLGTAYREMDLIDEAINEFQRALKGVDLHKGDQRVIQCCGMLSTCFLKRGMPRSALRWCQTGLNLLDNSSHEAMALRYDMGIAHSMEGSNGRALECFDQIFSLDPSYRDVAQKIDELKGGFERHASSP